MRGRPTLADYLVLLIRDASDIDDARSRDLQRKKLLADKDVSKAFGFSNCETLEQVAKLISMYRHLTSRKRSVVLLQQWVDHGELEEKIRASSLAGHEPRPSSLGEPPAVTKLFQKRNPSRAACVEYGFYRAWNLLISDVSGPGEFTDASHRVL